MKLGESKNPSCRKRVIGKPLTSLSLGGPWNCFQFRTEIGFCFDFPQLLSPAKEGWRGRVVASSEERTVSSTEASDMEETDESGTRDSYLRCNSRSRSKTMSISQNFKTQILLASSVSQTPRERHRR
ncbi:hypothetical protein ACFXTO_025367 [Malus domestica]